MLAAKATAARPKNLTLSHAINEVDKGRELLQHLSQTVLTQAARGASQRSEALHNRWGTDVYQPLRSRLQTRVDVALVSRSKSTAARNAARSFLAATAPDRDSTVAGLEAAPPQLANKEMLDFKDPCKRVLLRPSEDRTLLGNTSFADQLRALGAVVYEDGSYDMVAPEATPMMQAPPRRELSGSGATRGDATAADRWTAAMSRRSARKSRTRTAGTAADQQAAASRSVSPPASPKGTQRALHTLMASPIRSMSSTAVSCAPAPPPAPLTRSGIARYFGDADTLRSAVEHATSDEAVPRRSVATATSGRSPGRQKAIVVGGGRSGGGTGMPLLTAQHDTRVLLNPAVWGSGMIDDTTYAKDWDVVGDGLVAPEHPLARAYAERGAQTAAANARRVIGEPDRVMPPDELANTLRREDEVRGPGFRGKMKSADATARKAGASTDRDTAALEAARRAAAAAAAAGEASIANRLSEDHVQATLLHPDLAPPDPHAAAAASKAKEAAAAALNRAKNRVFALDARALPPDALSVVLLEEGAAHGPGYRGKAKVAGHASRGPSPDRDSLPRRPRVRGSMARTLSNRNGLRALMTEESALRPADPSAGGASSNSNSNSNSAGASSNATEPKYRPSRSPAHKVNPRMVKDNVFDLLRDPPRVMPGAEVQTKVDVRAALARQMHRGRL